MSPWRLTGLLLLAALLSWWVYRAVQTGPEKTAERTGHVPEAYATALETRRYDRDGRLMQTLTAKRMTRFADDGVTELESPALALFPVEGPRWKATAARAYLSADGERIDLRERVRIHRLPGRGTPPGLLATRRLLVFPERDEAETDEKITWRTPDLTVTAVGMRARLDTSEVDLLSQVRARLAPPHDKDES